MNPSSVQKLLNHLKVLLVLILAFLIGSSAGMSRSRQEKEASHPVSSASSSWGLSFQEKGKRPVANATIDELAKYDAFYAQDTEEKRLYLTFDAGYDNGNTAPILDALKNHQAPAAFFVVGNFIEDHPDLILRMQKEGHLVGNHTMTHPDMSKIGTMEEFQQELSLVEQLYEDATGEKMTKLYRPPQGIYSTTNLSMAKELGYHTFFWSLAYVDWYEKDQPTREEAFEKLLGRIHPGAIVLLHSTSATNAQILDELLDKWTEMGYTFHPLSDLFASDQSSTE